MRRSLALDPDRVLRDVGRRLAELRRERELTQEELAERAGVATKYLQQIEAGRENLTLRSLAKFANLLGVGLAAIVKPPRSREVRVGRPPRPRKAVSSG